LFFYYVEQSCSSISKLSILIVLLCKLAQDTAH